MKFKFRWFEKKVDERQERDIMQVEHIGFWLMYWMLAIAVFVQAFFIEGGEKHMMAEFVIIMITSVVVLAGWIRKGVWSYYTRKVPGVKAYLGYSLITMAVVGLPLGVLNGCKWKMGWQNTLLVAAVMMGGIFIFTFAIFCVIGTIARKREEKLANEINEENDEEDL